MDMKVESKIYDKKKLLPEKGLYHFQVGRGFASYLIGILKDFISREDLDRLMSVLYQTNYRTQEFPQLRDYQNQDVLHLLKYRFGLFTCYTGYGKSQVIATLADYALSIGKRVLLLAPNIKAKDELIKRCKSVFNIDIPKDGSGQIAAMITNGVLNKKEYKTKSGKDLMERYLGSFDWVLVDEVEYCISPGGKKILDCLQAECMYGFSGTTDKSGGEMIHFSEGLTKKIGENRDLIKYFGPTLVYRLPLHLNIDIINIKSPALSNVRFEESDFKGGNTYYNVMTRIWKNDEICRTLLKVAKKFPMLFIPINYLAEVINVWIEDYFLGKLRVLLISGEGYIYYDLDGSRKKVNLTEACDLIRDKKVDVIPSTSSGYRALDFPGLENIFLIQGNIAGVVLQCIGRVARGSHLNIISLDTTNGRGIPVYSNGREKRMEMINEYYRYCNVNEHDVDDTNLISYRVPSESKVINNDSLPSNKKKFPTPEERSNQANKQLSSFFKKEKNVEVELKTPEIAQMSPSIPTFQEPIWIDELPKQVIEGGEDLVESNKPKFPELKMNVSFDLKFNDPNEGTK